MNAESIADKIKRYRKINNMSQEELSTLSGINVSTIRNTNADTVIQNQSSSSK